jgi:hypothetical protein
MNLRSTPAGRVTLFRIGMACLAVGAILPRLLQPFTGVPDFITYGAVISLDAAAIWLWVISGRLSHSRCRAKS